MRLLALVCVLLLSQDPADKVRALVEKLGSDEIEAREAAVAELIKLGPAALPAIRDHVAMSEGERKARLQAIIVKLERDDRVAKLLAPGPTVTLKVKDRPAAEVLAEISKQAGVTVDAVNLPAGTLLSLDADRLALPAAVDEVCRRHGGIMHEWSVSRVRIRPGPYRKKPAFDAGPFRFIADGFVWSVDRGRPAGDARLSLKGVLVGPPGRLPPLARLEFDVVFDDQGNDLGPTGPRWGFTLGDLEWPAANPAEPRFCRLVWRNTPGSAELDATKLAKCRGTVRLTFILASKRLITLKAKPGAVTPESEEKNSLRIEGLTRDGRKLKVFYHAYHEVGEEAETERMGPTWIALHDAAGRRIEGHDDFADGMGFSSGGGVTHQVDGSLTFTLPEGFEPETVDLMEGSDLVEVKIPFDLGEVPLK